MYPLLNPSQLTAAASNRVCNALALLQCIASHSETRQLFLNGLSFSLLPTAHVANDGQLTYHSSFTHSLTRRPSHDRSSTYD